MVALSRLLARIRAAPALRPAHNARIPVPLSLRPTRIQARNMSKVTKSESEWRAILSPEQVRVRFISGTERVERADADAHRTSSASSARRAPSPRARASTRNTRARVSTPARAAARRCTRARPSLIVGADGLRSSMVRHAALRSCM